MRTVCALFFCLLLIKNTFSLSTPQLSFTPDVKQENITSSLRNKTIVFLGDSISRYQYLNLITLLQRDRWPHAFADDLQIGGSVCCEAAFRSMGGWTTFFNRTNYAFNGNELCDCVRTAHDSIENRHYYNPALNTTVAFFWLGRTPAIVRPSFLKHNPFDRRCRVTDLPEEQHLPVCSADYLKDIYNHTGFFWGDAIYTIGSLFAPDLFVINWGHHSKFDYQFPRGKRVYESVVQAVDKLKSQGLATRFVWKETTPICKPLSSDAYPTFRCEPVILSHNKSTLVGPRLVSDGVLELLDTHSIIQRLYREVKTVLELTKDWNHDDSASMSDWFATHLPMFWDVLHPLCWVHTELNRALVSQFFLNISYVQ